MLYVEFSRQSNRARMTAGEQHHAPVENDFRSFNESTLHGFENYILHVVRTQCRSSMCFLLYSVSKPLNNNAPHDFGRANSFICL